MSNDTDRSRAYVVHLRNEHRKLHGVLQRIKRDWFTVGEGTQPSPQGPKVVEELQALRSNLVEHFAEEEEGGCLEEAVCRWPKLGPEADRIEREHPALLAELDEIIVALSRSGKGVERASCAQQKFEFFVKKLHAHEAAENHILEVAFGIAMDAGD